MRKLQVAVLAAASGGAAGMRKIQVAVPGGAHTSFGFYNIKSTKGGVAGHGATCDHQEDDNI